MPSASAKVEKVASSEATDPVKQIVNMLEKRMRNLEKRKMKLDNYRLDVKNGKELNEDQKIAVSKYDQVESLLEFTKEFSKAMNAIVLESARQQKKLAKKEQLERQQHEIQRLQEAFLYRHILSCFQNEDVRSDFLNGENSAVLLTSEQLSQLDHLYKLIGPGLPSEQADLTNHFHVLAENHIFLVEGKNKEIAGTTYKVLKELLSGIKDSGYFSRPSEPLEEDAITSSDEMPEEESANEKLESNKEKLNSADDNESNQASCNETVDEVSSCNPLMPASSGEEIGIESTPNLQNGPLQEVLSSQSSFNFLQESQIDLDAPHMDPAVVAVHQMAPPPAVNFAVNPYPPSPPAEDMVKPVLNGADQCDMTVQQPLPPISQVPVMPTGISRSVAPPVITPVQHEFDPSHPIPTQTFTNQSFAVMQNMIMPQAYVPVTMHHGPIPPHITPIAVLPGLSPPVTSAGTSVVPLHVPITQVPVPSAPESSTSNEAEPKVSENEDNQQITDESAVTTDVEPSTNNLSNDKNGENNGYTPSFRSGYRGRGRNRGGGYFRGRSSYSNVRGGYQNHYYQDRNGYNGNFRRGNNNRGPRGSGNSRGRGNYRTQGSQQQQPQQHTQQE